MRIIKPGFLLFAVEVGYDPPRGSKDLLRSKFGYRGILHSGPFRGGEVLNFIF